MALRSRPVCVEHLVFAEQPDDTFRLHQPLFLCVCVEQPSFVVSPKICLIFLVGYETTSIQTYSRVQHTAYPHHTMPFQHYHVSKPEPLLPYQLSNEGQCLSRRSTRKLANPDQNLTMYYLKPTDYKPYFNTFILHVRNLINLIVYQLIVKSFYK